MRKRFFRYFDSVIKMEVEREGKKKFETGSVLAAPEEELDSAAANHLFQGLRLHGLEGSSSQDFNEMKIEEKTDGFSITIELHNDQAVLGLGQTIGPLNKRGGVYEMYNTDEPDHSPSKRKLYSTLPIFYISSPERQIGFFLDHPGYSRFDVGFEIRDRLKIDVEGSGFDLFMFFEKPEEILRDIFKLTGNPMFLPIWSLGYHQSRWSYADEKTVLDIAKEFRDRKIPCDAIYLDIDYMDEFMVFTWNSDRFPEPSSMIDELSSMGMKVVAIVDPGVKAVDGYDVFEDGIKNDSFCKREDGRLFRAAVWPGESSFPDFLNAATRSWWGEYYDRLLKNGIAGFWNDMNEPAIFYTPESLKELRLMSSELEDRGIETEFLFGRIMSKKKYHDYGNDFTQRDDGGIVHLHSEVRNIYGFNMARAAYEGIRRYDPGRRPFNITRSSYPGIQRYAILWTGDNDSQWEHLLSEIRLVQSISLAGVSFTGCDVGGFGGDCSGELLVRWTQFGAFLPFFRNHSAIGTRRQEPWAFDEEVERLVKKAIDLRYSLLPYLYSIHKQSVDGETTMIRPLSIVWPQDRETYYADDQFMLGPAIMVAPVYQRNSEGRHVYLPEGEWLDLNSKSVIEGGHIWVNAPLNTVPHFQRRDTLLVTTASTQYTESGSWGDLHITGFVEERAEFDLYEDDGFTYAYKTGEYSIKKLVVTNTHHGIKIEIRPQKGTFMCKERVLSFEIYNESGLYEAEIRDSHAGCDILVE
ncbi:MAG: glycoside hydrolase family 31 protein [Thermotogota bacterium]|nr:glycoside hydrolase family 31 protein [Thermotogota bacterium]